MDVPSRVLDRIHQRIVMPDGNDGCWLWTGGLSGGYGRVTWSLGKRQMVYAFVHRVMYEAAHGTIPPGMDIDHRCHIAGECRPAIASDCIHRRCCNPSHLAVATRQTNLLRGNTTVASRSQRTHCPQGHPYDNTNTRRDRRGRRICQACTYARNRAYYWANRDRRKEYNRRWRDQRRERDH